ncbi:hypothetical protein DID88_007318 [Monilinia fructigena]|uniref:Uncharacterized protein n=1 Tax=Monilinia fructigena TaxID=38457 RepID=A0A395J7Y5_9HELO|nr:hypothetical protein DID88_007318 [Monilinia fructigena]
MFCEREFCQPCFYVENHLVASYNLRTLPYPCFATNIELPLFVINIYKVRWMKLIHPSNAKLCAPSWVSARRPYRYWHPVLWDSAKFWLQVRDRVHAFKSLDRSPRLKYWLESGEYLLLGLGGWWFVLLMILIGWFIDLRVV